MKDPIPSPALTMLALLLIVVAATATNVDPSSAARAAGAARSTGGRPSTVLIHDDSVSRFRVPPPERFSRHGIQTATLTIAYVPDGTKNVYGDTCYAWPSEAMDAFRYAADIWQTLINSTVAIKINACWTDLGAGILGYGAPTSYHRELGGDAVANTWYQASLANALSGVDVNDSDGFDYDNDGVDADAEMVLAYNRGFDWYYGTDGNTPPNRVDFSSVVLHEICHGLGFSGSMEVTLGVGSWGLGTPFPEAYDRFTEDGAGTNLIDTSAYPNPSIALRGALTGGEVYFDGPNANAANGGSRAELYAPRPWKPGSSYAHLDESYNNTVNALMTYSISDGESERSPGPVALGMLEDMGWTSASEAPQLTSISPSNGTYTETVQITNLAGQDFQAGAAVRLTKSSQSPIIATNVTVVSSDKITCDLNLNGAAVGLWDVVVANPDGRSGTLAGGFIVFASPPTLVHLPVVVQH
jgi:hypothetical protein